MMMAKKAIKRFEFGRREYNRMRPDLIWCLLRRDGPTCSTRYGFGCGQYFELQDLTIDHVEPLSEGGYKTLLDNLQLLCQRCHSKKTKTDVGWDSTPVTLLNPQSIGRNPKLSEYFVPSLIKLLLVAARKGRD